eukprot:15445608-Alexandrium_andersonii.AAC.1
MARACVWIGSYPNGSYNVKLRSGDQQRSRHLLRDASGTVEHRLRQCGLDVATSMGRHSSSSGAFDLVGLAEVTPGDVLDVLRAAGNEVQLERAN